MSTDKYHDLPAERLLALLERAGRAATLDLIHACLERRDELTPGLLLMLQQAPDQRWVDDDPRWYRQVHAGLLLIAYREPAALPSFMDLLRSPDDEDWAHEWFTPHLAAYGPAIVPFALDLLADETAPIWSRAGATEILSKVASAYPQERETILGALRSRLPAADRLAASAAAASSDERLLWTWAVVALSDLRDAASREQVSRLFAAGLVDETVIGLEDYLADLEAGWPTEDTAESGYDILQEYRELQAMETRDHEYRERQARQRQIQHKYARAPDPSSTTYIRPEPKVGRNQPCPCGSGRKYKHCHGQR